MVQIAGSARPSSLPSVAVALLNTMLATVLVAACASSGSPVLDPPNGDGNPQSNKHGTMGTGHNGSGGPNEQESTAKLAKWADCQDGLECATVSVPADPDAPSGATLDISLVRVRSTGPARGSVFVNPGGPGASGVDFVRSGFRLDADTSHYYHLVGFDPRGSGSSDGLDCSVDLTQGPLADRSPDTPAEIKTLSDSSKQIVSDCGPATNTALPHLTAEAIAKDLDLLRAAVGDSKLHYVGFSYGTLIGLRYAQQFPDRVGHMVLDGVVDPSADLETLLAQQTAAFAAGFETMDAMCGSDLECPNDGLAIGYDQVIQTLEQTGPVGQVGTTEVETAILTSLYDERLWGFAASAIANAQQGDFSDIESLNDLYYAQADFTAYAAVSCADTPHPVGDTEWDAMVERLVQLSPRFGAAIGNELRVCAYWPVAPTESPSDASVDASATFVLIGTSGDAATPLANAKQVASLNPQAALVEVDGDHHTAYNSSACVRDIVRDYLVDNHLPPTTSFC